MKTKKECLVLLYNNYILENITGGIVQIVGCKQVIHQRNPKIKRKRLYSFSNPEYWRVIDLDFNELNVVITPFMVVKYYVKSFLCKIGGLL